MLQYWFYNYLVLIYVYCISFARSRRNVPRFWCYVYWFFFYFQMRQKRIYSCTINIKIIRIFLRRVSRTYLWHSGFDWIFIILRVLLPGPRFHSWTLLQRWRRPCLGRRFPYRRRSSFTVLPPPPLMCLIKARRTVTRPWPLTAVVE